MWIIRSASVVGRSHALRSAPSDDAFLVHALDDAIFLAVSDGAGSAPRSREGSTRAVEKATEYLAARQHELGVTVGQDEQVMREAFVAVHDSINQYASDVNALADEFACTLLLVALTPAGVCLAQIGDGAIVVGVNGDFTIPGEAPASEFVNETVFITSAAWQDSLSITTLSAVDASLVDDIAVFSDGLEPIAIIRAQQAPHPPFFSDLFKWLHDSDSSDEALHQFLSSDRVQSKSDDDITLVIASRRPERSPEAPQVSGARTPGSTRPRRLATRVRSRASGARNLLPRTALSIIRVVRHWRHRAR